MRKCRNILVFLLMALSIACHNTIPNHAVTSESIVDTDYLTQKLWDDGKAEIAFYNVERYLQVDDKKTVLSTIAASVLVKHDYDPIRLMKAVGFSQQKVPSFQWLFYYQFEIQLASQYSFSVHTAQKNLHPLKQTFSTISFEGNGYHELSFLPDSTIKVIIRGDRFSQSDEIVAGRPNAYTIGLVPLLVRALDFGKKKQFDFWVVLLDGEFIPAYATGAEPDTLKLYQNDVVCEKVKVTYSDLSSHAVGITAYLASEETYWRSTAPNRQILQMQSSVIETGMIGKKVRISYRMKLIEELRSAYWEEDIRMRLKHVHNFP